MQFLESPLSYEYGPRIFKEDTRIDEPTFKYDMGYCCFFCNYQSDTDDTDDTENKCTNCGAPLKDTYKSEPYYLEETIEKTSSQDDSLKKKYEKASTLLKYVNTNMLPLSVEHIGRANGEKDVTMSFITEKMTEDGNREEVGKFMQRVKISDDHKMQGFASRYDVVKYNLPSVESEYDD